MNIELTPKTSNKIYPSDQQSPEIKYNELISPEQKLSLDQQKNSVSIPIGQTDEEDFFLDNKSKKEEKSPLNEAPISISLSDKLLAFGRLLLNIFCCGKGVSYKTNELKQYFMLRVRVRYWSLFLFTAVLIFVCCGFYFGIRHTDTLIYRTADITNVNIDIKNCMVFVHHYDDPANILVKYLYYYKIDPYINTEITQTLGKISLNNNNLNIKVYSELSELECKIEIFASKNFNPKKFQVNCQQSSTCIFVQDSEQFSSKEMIIQNGNIYANFKNLIANSFQFKTTKGHLQLNRFTIGFARIELKYGDIFLQSSDQDLSVSWKNQQQTFCFSAPFITHSEIQDCYIADQTASIINQNKTSCAGSTTLCLFNSCSLTSYMSTMQTYGNLYINRISIPYIDVSNSDRPQSTSQGGVYLDGIDLEPNFKTELKNAQEAGANKSVNNIFIIDLVTQKQATSSQFSRWVISTNPSFAYLKPWYLSTFSISLLTSSTYTLHGTFSPGFCPGHIDNTLSEIYEMQHTFADSFSSGSVISYIANPNQQSYLGEKHLNFDGIVPLSEDRRIEATWVSTYKDYKGETQWAKNEITGRTVIIATLSLSFVGAFLIGLTGFMLFKMVVIAISKKIIRYSAHNIRYSEFVNEKEGNNTNEFQDVPKIKIKQGLNVGDMYKESSLSNFFKTVPRISAFVSYYSNYLIKRYLINSVAEFCDHLLNPNFGEEYNTQFKTDKINRAYIEIKERPLKSYYEKFCFLNNYPERSLSDAKAMKILKEYDFELINDDKESEAFTRLIQIQNTSNLDFSELRNKDPLEFFFKSYYKTTNNDLDYVYCDDFKRAFDEFCDQYRLEAVGIRNSEIAENNNLGLLMKTRKKLVKKGCQDHQSGCLQKLVNVFMFLVTFGSYKSQRDMIYFIDEDMLKFHFSIMVNPDGDSIPETSKNFNCDKITKEYIRKKMIYHSYWFYWVGMDLLMICLNMFVSGLIVLPFIFISLLEEISFSPYSILSDTMLITKAELMEIPFSILGKISVLNIWNIAIIFLCILYMILSFFDSIFFFFFLSFPEERAFQQNQVLLQKYPSLRFFTNLQWTIIFFTVFCYCCYVGLVCLWLLLGAIIDPNNFLVYATSAATFFTFLTTKYKNFQQISTTGMETVKKMVVSAIEEQFKGVITLVMAEIKTLSQQGKDLINNDFTESVLSEASNFGFDDEIQKFKKMSLAALEHPEELIENVSNTIKNHTKVIEKLKEAQEEIKNKAISTFKSKLKAYNIPESVCSIFSALMTKDQEKLEKELAALISSGSKHILGLQLPIPEDFIISCLQLVNHPKNLNTSEEISKLVVKDLMGSIFNVLVEGKANETTKGTFIKIIDLISASKNRDKTRILQILSELIRNFRILDRNYEETLLILFQVISSFGDVQSLPQVKQSIISILENIHFPKVPIKTFKELFLFAMGGFPDATIEIAGVRLKEFQQIHSFLLNGLKEFGINFETKEEVCLLMAYLVKIVKNQWEPCDFDQLDDFINDFFEIHKTHLKDFLEDFLKDFLKNIAHFLPFMYFSGRNQKVFWSDIATRLEIDKQMILELMFLTTENVCLLHNPSRIDFLEAHDSFGRKSRRNAIFSL